MQEGTQKLLRTYYFVVDQILVRFNGKRKDKLRLHNAFKAFYRNSFESSHTSLKDFSRDELNFFIDIILITFSQEYGIYLLKPNDPPNAEELSLSEYLLYRDWMIDDDYSLSKGIKTPPDGFVLIEDLEGLKRLKNRKRKWKPDNIEYRHGETFYVYSPREEMFFPKVLNPIVPLELIQKYIDLKLLYGEPTKR